MQKKGEVWFTSPRRQKVELLMIQIGFVFWMFAAKKKLPLDSVVFASTVRAKHRGTYQQPTIFDEVKTIGSHIERWKGATKSHRTTDLNRDFQTIQVLDIIHENIGCTVIF